MTKSYQHLMSIPYKVGQVEWESVHRIEKDDRMASTRRCKGETTMNLSGSIQDLVQVILAWLTGQGNLFGLLRAWYEVTAGIYPVDDDLAQELVATEA